MDRRLWLPSFHTHYVCASDLCQLNAPKAGSERCLLTPLCAQSRPCPLVGGLSWAALEAIRVWLTPPGAKPPPPQTFGEKSPCYFDSFPISRQSAGLAGFAGSVGRESTGSSVSPGLGQSRVSDWARPPGVHSPASSCQSSNTALCFVYFCFLFFVVLGMEPRKFESISAFAGPRVPGPCSAVLRTVPAWRVRSVTAVPLCGAWRREAPCFQHQFSAGILCCALKLELPLYT